MVGGVAHSGRVIFAAAAVMVAVFFTFALSGPLPPKEMGVILGIAVLLDALLVRLLLVPCCCGCWALGVVPARAGARARRSAHGLRWSPDQEHRPLALDDLGGTHLGQSEAIAYPR